ncbi:hypothetical protein [Dysosmobacter sp.]
MTPKDEHTTEYDPLTAGTDVPAAGDFSLEEILAEYGGGRRQKILRDVEEAANPGPEPVFQPEEPQMPCPAPAESGEPPSPPAPPESSSGREEPERAEEELEGLSGELPRSPRPISLEEVVGSTVDAVMEEHHEPIRRHRQGLFSRRKLEETEMLYQPPEPEPEEEPIGPEPEPRETAEEWKDRWQRRRALVPAVFAMALVPALLLAAEQYGLVIPWWSDSLKNQALVLLGCLAASALLAGQVFAEGVRMLSRRRCTGEVIIALSAIVSGLDCVDCLLAPERTAVMPYAAVSCAALAFAQWGLSRRARAIYDTFRTAALDEEPPYLVAETEQGACKQRGAVPGFYTTASADDMASLWQTALLPVVAVGSVVFAGLSSLGQGRGADFLLNWSAILASGASFALAISYALPWSRLARHLQKTGCAVAGWLGGEKISARRTMIVTDGDLFPPGTIQLNGVKVFGEELRKAYAYAATMARCAGCGLERLFDGLLRGENGQYEIADDFSFYEEGGYSATIHGESVLMGTASFMRKMEVRLPGGINLKTGVFLAVDRTLIAVFAVKYNTAENVDFALRMMRRSRIMPILAARDPNITPALIKRKFYKKAKVEYPDLSTRVALSEAEQDRGSLPRALLFREGLLPYAETVVGCRRMCRAVRRGTGLALFGSAAGTLLAFYLVSLGEYSLLTPLALLVFLLLWVLPVLLLADWTGRY